MTPREVVKAVLDHETPPYVPWSFGFTREAKEKLFAHYGVRAGLEEVLGDHLVRLGSDIGFFEDIDVDLVRDVFGVVWDRSIDKDIGSVQGSVLPDRLSKHTVFPTPSISDFSSMFR